MKWFLAHIMRLSGESKQLPSRSTMAERAGKVEWLGRFTAGKRWGQVSKGLYVLNLHQHQRKERPGFPDRLPTCETGGQKDRMSLKNDQQSNLKNWNPTLYFKPCEVEPILQDEHTEMQSV